MAQRTTKNTWMSLRAGLGDLVLQEHHQAYSQFRELRSPTTQLLQTIMFIGSKMKTLALRKLRLGSESQELPHGEVRLRLVPESISVDWPVLIADCELHNSLDFDQEYSDETSGLLTRRSAIWHHRASKTPDPTTLAHLLYSKVLAPFSNVICFFADDFGGIAGLSRLLATWLVSPTSYASSTSATTYPRVLILQQWHESSTFDEQVATKRFMLDLRREVKRKNRIPTRTKKGQLKQNELDYLIAQQFGSIRVLAIPDINSVSRAWKYVKCRIQQDSNEMQQERTVAQVAFSARHFKGFVGLACEHFCGNVTTPFNFIRASRISNPVPEELEKHLTGFLEMIDPKDLLTFAAPVIGSALAFESYPPGMHGFKPASVFKEIFYQTCLKIYPLSKQTRHHDGTMFPKLIDEIEVSFSDCAFGIIDSKDDGVNVHQSVLERFKDQWQTLHSNTICFSCFCRRPESSLQCHHSLCTFCIRAHGMSTPIEPWTFTLKQCPFCQESNSTRFPQKPDTAGVRALIVEGGGTRGIIPLTFLEELERAVGLQHMNIQEHFDIAFGNSAGALVILGLYSNVWTIDDCVQSFLSLVGLAFRKRICYKLPFISSGLVQLCLSFITDSKYGSSGINSALKLAYGGGSLFELPALGTKLAAITTTTKDSSTCLLANYNGPLNRPNHCGYRITRPEDSRSEVSVWEAARASSAAPPYFKSFHGYQDGALGGHNNPINLALWEQDIIWSRSKKQPDVVVSLGTGFKRSAGETIHDGIDNLSFLQSRYVPRLLRSFLNFFDGEVRWRELQNTLLPHHRNRYHRMNIEFHGEEPELDDLKVIQSLRQQTRCQAISHKTVQQCADNILAALFYLVLDGMPEFEASSFICKGTIRCRLSPLHPAMRTLVARLEGARFYLDFEQWIPCTDPSGPDSGKPFSRPISFKVASLEHSIDIKIDGIVQRARSISNCPYVIQTLIEDQGLDYSFGSRRLKRKSEGSSLEDGPELKRRWSKG